MNPKTLMAIQLVAVLLTIAVMGLEISRHIRDRRERKAAEGK